jgi:hypothetical protein
VFTPRCTLAVLVLAAAVPAASAERPPEQRDEADLVVVGTVTKVTPEREKFGPDGTVTHYKARVKVHKVERGKGAEAGRTLP